MAADPEVPTMAAAGLTGECVPAEDSPQGTDSSGPGPAREVAELSRLLDLTLGEGAYLGGTISPEAKQRSLAQRWRLPFLDLRDVVLDREVVRTVPDFLLRQYRVLPVRREGNVLTVATADALNVQAMDEIRRVTGYEVHPVLAVEKEVLAALDDCLGLTSREVATMVADAASAAENVHPLALAPTEHTPQDLDLHEDAPAIVRLVALIIAGGLHCGASDIHIQPEEKFLRVRYRLDGMLRDASHHSWRYARAIAARLKVMARMDIAEHRRPQDGRISFTTGGKQYDLRVSTFPGIYGEKIVMRLAERASVDLTLEQLGFHDAQLHRFEDIISHPYGMVLVTGPTGSGKTTTLYSVLHRISRPEKNVMTVEDPVERRLPGVTQGEVGSTARSPFTFATAIRSILRQDPNVIMVGEIRDQDTAEVATQAALTGHLVLSTLHTNDAPSALPRLIDLGVEPFLVSSALIGVLAQRLVRVLCPRCKEAGRLSPEDLARLRLPLGELDGELPVYKPRGCPACDGRGYHGRVGVFELLAVTDEIRRLILQRAPAGEIEKAAREQGMATMLEDAFSKVCQGVTSVEEMVRVVDWA
jgi:type IV pilus assembly protein PilB